MKRDAAAVVAIGLLMAGYVASYAWGGFIQDTARDVYYAYEIAAGRWFPLEGPILGGAIHLGPLWYYLLALPAAAGGGWLAIALFAGALAALQFPLAYDCGTRLLDRRLGLLWAVCLALPGWPSFQSLIFFNPNPAGAVVLAVLALWLRAQAPRHAVPRTFAAGLLAAAALHVHPTTAPIVLLALDIARRSVRAGARPVPVACAFAAGFAIPFLPYLANQWMTGMPDASGAAHYLGSQVAAANLVSLPRLLWAHFFSGPAQVFRYLWPSSSASAFAPLALDALPLLATALVAVRAEHRERRVLAGLAAALVVLTAWAALMRSATPEYFLYAAAPFAAGMLALGLRALFASAPGVARVVLAVQLAAIVAVPVRMAGTTDSGEGTLDSRILDVGNAAARTKFSETWLPAWAHGALGRLLCSGAPRVTLHGPLAFVADRSVGADAMLACGTVQRVVLMGRGGPQDAHWVGLSRRFWRHLDGSPECRLGSLGLVSRVAVHAPRSGVPIADGRRYLPRERVASPSRPGRLDFEGAPGAALLVTNPLHGYAGLARLEVSADGRAVAPAARNDLAQLFVAPSPSATVRWSVSFDANDPGAVDIVTFRPRAAGPPPPPCFP